MLLVNWRGKGGPRNLFFIGILLFLLLRSPRKISKLAAFFLVKLAAFFLVEKQQPQREERRENNGKYYGHFGASARTPLGPKLGF